MSGPQQQHPYGTMPGAPLDPAQAAHNKRVIVGVTIAFVAVSLFVIIWGWFVTNTQREMAGMTDRALKSTGWTILCYAAQHDGQFPTSDAQMLEARVNEAPPAIEGLPRAAVQALDGAQFMDPAEAAEYVTVLWPPHGDLAPVIGIKTTVSGIGTVDQVNGWLKKFAQSKAVGSAATKKP